MNRIQFDQIGGDWVDPPLLMPASLPLELSGEVIRNRLITSSDGPGEELALRPDLTLAVARLYLEAGCPDAVSYRYFGRAFRQPVLPGEPMEFDQTGFENFGHDDGNERDVATLGVISEEIAAAGVRDAQINLGDISIFHDVVASLELAPFWEAQINRSFRRQEGIKDLLTGKIQPAKTSSALADTLASLPENEAGLLLDEILSMSGGQVIGGRTRDDILERLQHRAEAVRVGRLPDHACRALSDVIGIEGSPGEFLSRLTALTQAHGLKLDAMLERTTRFFDALTDRNVPFWPTARVSVQFGRRFDYYDGLVFELSHKALATRRPIAAGGRYDGLISRMSNGAHSTHAVGGVVRPDRLRQVLAEQGDA